jgi:hypothetical protein
MGYAAHLLRIWAGSRNTHRPLYQVAFPRKPIPRSLALLGAIAAVVLCSSPIRAQGEGEGFTDVSVRTGADLSGYLEQLMKQPDLRVAIRYFEDQKARPDLKGLADIQGRNVKTNEKVRLFFIPFAEPTPTPGVLKLVVLADGSQGPKVLLGTASEEVPRAGEERAPPAQERKIVVKDEHLVRDGKIEPGNGALQKFLLCTFGGCLAAVPCLAAGITPLTIGCVCATCTGIGLSCYAQIYR